MSRELLVLAQQVAAEAGALILRMRAEGVEVAATKTSEVDVVTRADRASEELIRQRILAVRPDDGFLGEEGDDIESRTGVRWIVDPIDGTVNYLYGIDQYAVSIAVEVEGTVVAGVVFNPATGEEFSAVAGEGAHLNGTRLQARTAASLAVSLVNTGFNYDSEVRARQGRAVGKMISQVRDIRREGSCALDLCSVAMGRTDAYVEEGTHPWDWSAGALVATEAGARFELRQTAAGSSLIVCAVEPAFTRFEGLVRDCTFFD